MDEIQQKIKDFQRQLLPSQSLLKQTLFSCPALLPTVGLIVGLVLQFYFHPPLIVWLAVLVLCILLYLLHKLTGKTSTSLVLIIVFLCFVCLGGIRLTAYNSPASNDIRNLQIEDFTFAHIRAKIISDPRVIVADENDWLFSKFSQSLPYTTFYAKIISIKTDGGWTPATGIIKFYISQDVNFLKMGDELQSFCRLERFAPADNPGQFDIARYMNRNGVFLSASIKSANSIIVLGSEKLNSPFDIKAKLHDLVVTALHGDTEPDNNMRLVEALLLGSRTKIDRQLYNDFIKTGLVHLVCLSGLNVGILAGAAWWLSKKANLLHRGRSIACIIATIIFLLVVPARSPTLRAGIMFIIFCLGPLFGRRSKPLNSLAISAVFLLLIRPTDFIDAGFQLSFAATGGIVLFCPSFFNFLMSPFERFKKNFFYAILQTVLAVFSTGCTAWLAVTPITAWHFYQFQLFTAFWTVPASLPMAVILVLGTLKILLTPLLPTLAAGLAVIVDFSAKILSFLVTIFAKVPLSHIIIGKPAIYIVLLFYLTFLLWKFFPFKRPAKNLIYPAAITFLLISAVCLNKFGKFNNMRLTVLSVGHGQAIVVQPPGGQSIIIDAGSISKNNVGDTIVNPFLNYIAADKINSIFISHDDIDHYNGLPEILKQHKCENVYTTPQFIQSDATSYTDATLSHFLESKKLPLRITPEKISFGKTTVTRLWPQNVPDENSLTDNESSLVLLFEYADRRILLCSDITKDVQNQLINLYPQLDVDLIVTPHHGSGRTASPAFSNYFKPEFLITSCSDARFSSISPQITEHPQSYYTCKDGAVTILINSQGKIKIKTFRPLTSPFRAHQESSF